MKNKKTFIPYSQYVVGKDLQPEQVFELIKKNPMFAKEMQKKSAVKSAVPTASQKRKSKLYRYLIDYSDNCLKKFEKLIHKNGNDFIIEYTKICQKVIDIFVGRGKKVDIFEYPYTLLNKLFNSETDSGDKTMSILQKGNFDLITALYEEYHESKDEMYLNILGSIQQSYCSLVWAKQKQIFCFDNEFADELINTDNIVIVKDIFDYLPYSMFYIDMENTPVLQNIFKNIISEYAKDKDAVIQGSFFNCFKSNSTPETLKHEEKTDSKEYYEVSFGILYKTKKETVQKTFCFLIPNEDAEMNIADYVEKMVNVNNNTNDCPEGIGNLLQIIVYLCSEKPDIQENEETKKAYKKPVSSFHSITDLKYFEVGVRFGTSVREWKSEKEQKLYTDKTATSKYSHSSPRPHYRRGHWHSYWYKAENGGKVKKPKWLAPTLVNGSKFTETDYIIHKADNS